MPRKRKEPVEKVCKLKSCGKIFSTRFPDRAEYCPGSKCRSKAWDEAHRVQSKEAFAREVLREHWRAEWRRNGPNRRQRRRASKKQGVEL
jgi:hypothetical protein